jgi:ABC-2 type transport system permease protein
MNLKRILALASKEWREILRDRLFLTLAFLVPLLWMWVFGYGLTLDVEHLPFAVLDQDRSEMSRDFVSRFASSRYFQLAGYVSRADEIEGMLADNRIRLGLIIPPKFQERLASGRPAQVQTLLDGTFPYRAQTAKGYVIGTVQAFSNEHLAAHLERSRGMPRARATALFEPVRLEVRFLYNQEVKSIWFLAPALIMFVLMVSPPLLTALSVVREKETGSIYNIYASTVGRGEFLLGKLAPNVLISFGNALVLWLMATWWFGAPFKGSPWLFAAATLLFVLCSTGIGLLVSLLVRTQVAALLITVVLALVPTILYSGMFVPVTSLTTAAKVEAHLFPGMYYNNVLLGVFLKGTGLGVLWPDLAALAVYAGGLLATGYLLFRKRPSA